MADPKILLGNDHLIQILGLEDLKTLLYINDATVAANLLSGIGGTLITGGGPVSMPNVPAGDVGGAGSDTVVKSKARAGDRSVTVTVGATNPLALSAADWIHFHDHEQAYQISAAAAGIAGADVVLLLEASLRADVRAGEPVFAVAGVYEGVLQDTVSIVSGTEYALEITATGGATAIDAKTNIVVTADDRED